MPTDKQKIDAINYFLNDVLNDKAPIEERKLEMRRVGRKFCGGLPEWSDVWGINLKPIDDITHEELVSLIQSI